MTAASMARTARAERALWALRMSGRRLVLRAQGWAVAGRDLRRRPVATLSDAEAQAIIAGGFVSAAEGGGYVLTSEGAARVRDDAAAQQAIGHILAREAAARQATRRGAGADFSTLAAMAASGEGALSMRAARAGVRLGMDGEQASRREMVSMSWDGMPIGKDRSRRGGGEPGFSRAARSSRARLQRVAAAVGDQGFALAWAACVEGVRLRVLETRFGLAKGGATAALGAVLEAAADAYDAGG